MAVKVYPDDHGTAWTSDVIKGLEWAVNDALKNGNILQCVANMSLGGTVSIAGERAVAAAVRAGLTVVVAGGNGGVCNPSPPPLLSQPSRVDLILLLSL